MKNVNIELIEPQAKAGRTAKRILVSFSLRVTAAFLATVAAGCTTTGLHNSGQEKIVQSIAADKVSLAVYESGNPDGVPIIFIHGFSQSHESWKKQFDDRRLQSKYRLIAYDLRGHGKSGKPETKSAYHDSRLWADDLRSVILSTASSKPVIVAWSYGGRVINDYLKHYGDEGLGGLNLVAATSTGKPLGRGSAAGLMASMLDDSPRVADTATKEFLRACFEKQPTDGELETMLRFNNETPVQVRKLLGGRSAEYDEVLAKIKVPVLLTHGDVDKISASAMSEYTKKLIPLAQLSIYERTGHSPFFEDAARFNAELDAFARNVGQSR